MKQCLGLMTKVAVMRIYIKNFEKYSAQEPKVL